MTRSGTLYDDQYSQVFYDKKESPRFLKMVKRIEEKCNLIRATPYTACHSELLRHTLKGKRSGHLDEHFRIIYMVCEECIKQGHQQWNNKDCPDCENVPLKRIRFIDITDYHKIS